MTSQATLPFPLLPPALRPPSPLSLASTAPPPLPPQYLSSPPSSLSLDSLPELRIADTLAYVLSELCRSRRSKSDVFPHPFQPAALFFSPTRQRTFSLSYYCRRLLCLNACSKSCLAVAAIYLMRIGERLPILQINDFNVHRLVCTAVMLAAKWLDDVSFSNAHYAWVAGVHTPMEMSRLEQYFLMAIDYRMYVSKECFEQVQQQFIHISLSLS